MSIGRNKGAKSESTDKSDNNSTQATNYGRDQATGSTADGNVNVSVEDLSDEALKETLDFAGESRDATERTFSELIGFTAERASASEDTADSAVGAIKTIAQDKATGQQRAQRMVMLGVGGVMLAGLLFTRSGKKAN